MSSIYVFGRDQDITYYYTFLLEGNYDCNVQSGNTLEKIGLDDLAKEKDLSLIVISTEMNGADAFIQGILSRDMKVPMILTHTNEHNKAAKIKYKYHALYQLLEEGKDPKHFLDMSHKALVRKRQIDGTKRNYCRIKSEYFMHSEKTICDIFLKLSDDKYVKVFNRHHAFSEGDIKKFIDKNNQYFYIQERDYKAFISLMSKALENEVLLKTKEGKDNGSAMTSMNCQEMVQEMLDKLGLNENAISITNVAITSTLKIVETGSLENLFNDVYNNGDFIAEHSLVVTYLACSICRETEWHTRENILRLCLAGFFHDITLSEEGLAKISSENSYEFNELTKREQSEVLNHSKKAVDVINKINGIPIGVDTIIEYHHEKYNGEGFPRHVDYKRFSPLAAIFSIAHEISDYLFESGFVQDNIDDIISEMEEKYTRGCFKKIIPVLEEVLGPKDKEKLGMVG